MNRQKTLKLLIKILLDDMPQYRIQADEFSQDIQSQWQLFRSLVNVRSPQPISKQFLKLQNDFLQAEIAQKGITDIQSLIPIQNNIYLWQGDITTLKVDGIVNAANSGMTGCYCPCHNCIDNAIHTFAGVQLRLECADLMKQQGYAEPTGQAKITKSYNLPSKYILHTVGPIVNGNLSKEDCKLLASCYQSCLKLAVSHKLKSIAFCCISTGEFHFPNQKAAEIAIQTVKEFMNIYPNIKIVFNVFKKEDYEIYHKLMQC